MTIAIQIAVGLACLLSLLPLLRRSEPAMRPLPVRVRRASRR